MAIWVSPYLATADLPEHNQLGKNSPSTKYLRCPSIIRQQICDLGKHFPLPLLFRRGDLACVQPERGKCFRPISWSGLTALHDGLDLWHPRILPSVHRSTKHQSGNSFASLTSLTNCLKCFRRSGFLTTSVHSQVYVPTSASISRSRSAQIPSSSSKIIFFNF